jgi:hypothetical protein
MPAVMNTMWAPSQGLGDAFALHSSASARADFRLAAGAQAVLAELILSLRARLRLSAWASVLAR